MKSFHNYKSLQSKIEKETNITLSHDKFLQYIRMYNFYRLLENIEYRFVNLVAKNESDKFYLDYIRKNIPVLFSFFTEKNINYPNLEEIDKIIKNNVYASELTTIDTDIKVNFCFFILKVSLS